MEKPPTATNGPIPQQNTFTFPDIQFSSDFDSGNLQKVEKISNFHYALWVGPDCYNTLCEKSLRTWFYFSVETKGFKTLTIKNLNLQGKLFRDGMKPLYRTLNTEWKRVESTLLCDVKGDVGSFFEVTFSFEFGDSPVFFAFSFPWSYSDHKEFLEDLGTRKFTGFYFHVCNLINTLEKRPCEILTVSNYNQIEQETEPGIPNLYENTNRAYRFSNKPIILITARVHPGETPSSHVLNGFIEFLISSDPRAVTLREHYVFKIVPMLNPDGVYRGYFRTDTCGVDLNRTYSDPVLRKHPTTYAIKELMKFYNTQLWAYIDLHAHVSKQGCFLYGNSLEFEAQIMNVLYAKVLSNTCPWFNFDNCCFLDELTNREKHGKEGCGRFVAQKLLKLVHSYTLEVNYHSCKAISPVLENKDKVNTILDIEAFMNTGRIACIGILYLTGKHPDPVVDLNELKLEVSKILAEQPAFKCNPEARKASKSIENLNRYISACNDNGKRFKYRLANILVDKKDKRVFDSSTPSGLPQIKYPQIIQELRLAKTKELSTKSVIANENSFQIRPRNGSFVKNRKNKKTRNSSLRVRESNKCPTLIIL